MLTNFIAVIAAKYGAPVYLKYKTSNTHLQPLFEVNKWIFLQHTYYYVPMSVLQWLIIK